MENKIGFNPKMDPHLFIVLFFIIYFYYFQKKYYLTIPHMNHSIDTIVTKPQKNQPK